MAAPATFTKSGVFEYRRADGSTVRELRPEDEVFSAVSLASLSHAPVIVDHLPDNGLVTAANARQHAVGMVTGAPTRQDSMVAGEVILFDAATIDRAKSKKLPEISMGYACRIDKTSGVDPVHGPYDQIQRDISYNHVALGPAGWGRAGGDVGIRLDSGDGISTDSDLTQPPAVPHNDRNETHLRGTPMKIKINGVTFDVEPAVAEAYAEERQRFDSIVAERDGLQGRFDAQAEELTKTKKDLEEALDTGRFDSAVNDRIELLAKARKMAGNGAKLEGSDREIMVAALRADNADLDFEGKSDEYVACRFDFVFEALPEREAAESKKNARRDTSKVPTEKPGDKDTRIDAKTAQQKMIEDSRNAWKQPFDAKP